MRHPLIDSLQVWAVLKPGFLAFLSDPFDTQPLDIIVFDVLPGSDGNGDGRVSLAKEIKDRNPLRHAFKVSSIDTYYFFFFPVSLWYSRFCFWIKCRLYNLFLELQCWLISEAEFSIYSFL